MVFSPFFVFFRLLENSVKSSKRAIFSSNRSESFDSGKGSATLGLFSVQKLLPSEVVSKSVLKALDGEMIQFNFHRERMRWKRFFILPLSKTNDQNSIIMCNQIKLRNVPFSTDLRKLRRSQGSKAITILWLWGVCQRDINS